jgi:hypothetical protein
MLEPLEAPPCNLVLTNDAINGDDLLQLSARRSHLEQLAVWVDNASISALTDSSDRIAAFNVHTWPSSLRSLSVGVRGVLGENLSGS